MKSLVVELLLACGPAAAHFPTPLGGYSLCHAVSHGGGVCYRRGASRAFSGHVIKEFRARGDAGQEQMITGTSTCNVQKVTLGIVDILKVSFVRD